MAKKRDIGKVIKFLIDEVIPPESLLANGLIQRLRSVANNAKYTAPEGMGRVWGLLGAVLDDAIGEPDCAWKLRVVRVMQGEDGPQAQETV